ncbi:MAG TPA: efflux RND transporter periplasmic adaptor subunit [Patescibacteria group bacterium]|nr:efflux RND transporter periplasmic adaptor subunit [Patescibacteria group bacterium]
MSELKGQLESLRIDRAAPAARGARRVPVWPIAVVLLGAAAIAAWLVVRPRLFPAVEVETVRPSVQSASSTGPGLAVLTASGYVVPRRKAVVSAKIQGRLSELRVEEGTRVKEGDVLARLESADYAAQVRSAEAAVQRAEADLAEQNRQLRLSGQLQRENVLSRDTLEAAESRVRMADAALQQARAQVEVAKAQLSNTVIRAPFTGVVLRKMAEVGESVAPIPPGVNLSTSSGAIVALADLDTLEVEADVSETNVGRLVADQPAEVSVEAFPDKRFRAVLRQVIPTADRTRATVQVKVTILDKDPGLKPEMNAKVNFLERPQAPGETATPRPATVTVPAGTVVERDGRTVVFELDRGRARARGVVSDASVDGKVVVREGLSGGETLIARPPSTMKDGDAVRVRG